MIKDIIKNLKPSSTLLINEISNKLEREGKKIFKFGFGQSPFKVPQDIVNELKGNAHQNKYLPMQGLEDLRVSIANYISKKKGLQIFELKYNCWSRIKRINVFITNFI